MRRVILLLFMWLPTACVVQTESVEGKQGPQGASGPSGSDGVSPFSYVDASMTDISYSGGRVGIGDIATGAPEQTAQLILGKTVDTNEIDLPTISHTSALSPGASNDLELATHSSSGGIIISTGAATEPRIVVNSEGRVGIGTTTPTASLEVVGETRMEAESDSAALRLEWPSVDFSIGQDGDVGNWVTLRSDKGDGIAIIGQPDTVALTVSSETNTVEIGTLDLTGTARLTRHTAQPFPCDTPHDGTMALTTKHRTCVCNGSSWVQTSNGLPCTWDADPQIEANYATSAVFRDQSPTAVDGDLKALVSGSTNGYGAAKAICIDHLDSPSAHMCTAEEVARSAAIGIAVPNGWYIAATYSYYSPLNRQVTDCAGFTTNNVAQMGHGWADGPNIYSCSLVLPVLCCDK